MIPNQWYAIVESRDLKNRPLGIRRFGEQLVLWRDGSGKPVCLRDRCPHKGMRLSQGRVVDGTLQCPYHGFRYDRAGACVHAPCLGRDAKVPASLQTGSYPVREEDGFLWLFWGAQREDLPDIPRFPDLVGDLGSQATYAWEWDTSYTRVMESLTELYHVPFVHASLGPLWPWVQRTRVDRLEVRTEGPLIQSDFHLRRDDGRSFEQDPGSKWRYSLLMPGQVCLKISDTHYACAWTSPIDEERCWVATRYYLRLPWPVPRLVERLAVHAMAAAERAIAQPQDWKYMRHQEPKVASVGASRLVAPDKMNAVYLQLRRNMQRAAQAAGPDRPDVPLQAISNRRR